MKAKILEKGDKFFLWAHPRTNVIFCDFKGGVRKKSVIAPRIQQDTLIIVEGIALNDRADVISWWLQTIINIKFYVLLDIA